MDDVTTDLVIFNATTEALNTKCLSKRNEGLARIEMATLAVILVLAFVSNLIVLLALWRVSRSKRLGRMKLLILHLSIADLAVALFNVLPQLAWKATRFFYGGVVLCKLVTYAQVLVLYASSYVLLATAIDRYVAICMPMFSLRWTNRYTHSMVAGAWMASLLLATPQLFIFSMREVAPNCFTCSASFTTFLTVKRYITFYTFAVYVIPTLTLLVTYGRVCTVVWKATSANEFLQRNTNNTTHQEHSTFLKNNKPSSQRNAMTSSKVKTVKLTATVIVCYLVCASPFFVAQMWWAWDETAPITGSLATCGKFNSTCTTNKRTRSIKHCQWERDESRNKHYN